MNANNTMGTIFQNVGSKIRSAAKVILIVGILSSIVFAIILFVKSGESSDSYSRYSSENILNSLIDLSDVYLPLGFIVLIGGTLSSVIRSFIVYGIGNIVDKYSENRAEYTLEKEPTYTTVKPISEGWECPKCGMRNTGIFCANCSTSKPITPKVEVRTAQGNEWQCPKCGKVNQNYVGTCGCGEVKPK